MTTREEWLIEAKRLLGQIPPLGDDVEALHALAGELVAEQNTIAATVAALAVLLESIPDVAPPAPTPVPTPTPVPEPTPVPVPSGTKPIYYYHPMSSSFGPTLAAYGAIKAYIVYQDVIDSTKDGKFDGITAAFKARVEKAPADYTGVIAFDWEHAFGVSGGFVKRLGGKDGAIAQSQAIAEAVKVLKAAKAIRPNAKVGFYAVPFNGWSATFLSAPPDWWWAQETALQPLLAVTDVLLPDIYQYFTIGGAQVSVAEDAKRMGNMAKLSLLASKGKPIMPFVWEIYHSAGPNSGVIPPDQIKLHVGAFCSTTLNGRRAADGLYWWGAGAGPDGTEPSLKAFREAVG